MGMENSPMQNLTQALRQHGLVRFVEYFARQYPKAHLKDLVVDRLGPHREMEINGRRVINFGSDSFLGLDQDPRVQQAIAGGVQTWGAHNSASRAFFPLTTSRISRTFWGDMRMPRWTALTSTPAMPSAPPLPSRRGRYGRGTAG